MPQRCGHHRDRRCSVCEMSLVDVRCSGPAGRTTPVFNGSTTWPRARAPCSRRQACGTAPHRTAAVGQSVRAAYYTRAALAHSLGVRACVRVCVRRQRALKRTRWLFWRVIRCMPAPEPRSRPRARLTAVAAAHPHTASVCCWRKTVGRWRRRRRCCCRRRIN